MTDYYLYSGMSGADYREIVKNATINKARAVAFRNFKKKPISISKITSDGKDTIYLGEVRRWGYFIDRYGIDRTDEYLCWLDKDDRAYRLYYNGSLGKRME